MIFNNSKMMNPLICCGVGAAGGTGPGGGSGGNVGGGGSGGNGGHSTAGPLGGMGTPGGAAEAAASLAGASPDGVVAAGHAASAAAAAGASAAAAAAAGANAAFGFSPDFASNFSGESQSNMTYADFDFSTLLESKLEEYTIPPRLSKALAPFPLLGQGGKIAAVLDSITIALGGTPGGGSGDIGEQGGPGEQNQQLLTNILQSIPDTKPESSLVSRLGLPSINKLGLPSINKLDYHQ